MSTTNKSASAIIDKHNAQRLKAVWLRQKALLNLKQGPVADLCGFSQPTFSQYLNGVIPLNLDAIFKIAAAIQVSPSEICPELRNVDRLFKVESFKSKTIILPVIGSTSGGRVMSAVQLNLNESLDIGSDPAVVVVVDTQEYLQTLGYPKGTKLVCSTMASPFEPNLLSVIRRTTCDEFEIIKTAKITKKRLYFNDMMTGDDSVETEELSNIVCAYLIKQVIMP